MPSKINLPMSTPGITKSTSTKAEICCGKCGVTFQSEDVLNKHIAIYHEKFVEKHTPTAILPTHVGAPTPVVPKKSTPPKPGTKICCGKCDETFSTVYFLNKHYSMYHDKPVEKPNRVSSPTPTMPTPIRSSPRKSSPKFCCAKCGSFFNDKDTLSKHIASVHVQFVEKPKPRVSSPAPILPTPAGAPTKSTTPKVLPKFAPYCGRCCSTFESEDSLNKHICKLEEKPNRVYSPASTFAPILPKPTVAPTKSISQKVAPKVCCGKCGTDFESEDSLNKHIAIVHDKLLYACPKCNFIFNNQGNLNKHIATNHNSEIKSGRVQTSSNATPISQEKAEVSKLQEETRERCHHCPVTFSNKKKLKDHIIKEHNEYVITL